MATDKNEKELTKSKVFEIIEYKGTNVISTLDVDDLPNFKSRDDDVWVCSFPRSGTTLTQQITYLIMTLDFEKATTVQLDERFPIADLNEPAYPYFRGLKYLDSLPENKPRMIKSHLAYYLLPEQVQRGKGKDRRGMIRRIAEFLGKDLTDAAVDKIFEYTTLESMKTNNAVNFMYFENQFKSNKEHGGYINTGEVSGWRKEFPPEHLEEMDKIIERATKGTDIKYE